MFKKILETVGVATTAVGLAIGLVITMMFAQGQRNAGRRDVLKKEEKEINKREERTKKATDDIEKMSHEEIRRRSHQKGWFRD